MTSEERVGHPVTSKEMTHGDMNSVEENHDNNSLSSWLEIYPHISWKYDKRDSNRPDDSRNLASFNIASGAQYKILYWESN